VAQAVARALAVLEARVVVVEAAVPAEAVEVVAVEGQNALEVMAAQAVSVELVASVAPAVLAGDRAKEAGEAARSNSWQEAD